MANTATLTTRAVPSVLTSHIWELTVDSDSSGNASIDVSWSDVWDAPTQWQAVLIQPYGTNTSSPENWGGSFTVVIDYANKRFRIRGRGLPASTTNIRLWLIAF